MCPTGRRAFWSVVPCSLPAQRKKRNCSSCNVCAATKRWQQSDEIGHKGIQKVHHYNDGSSWYWPQNYLFLFRQRHSSQRCCLFGLIEYDAVRVSRMRERQSCSPSSFMLNAVRRNPLTSTSLVVCVTLPSLIQRTSQSSLKLLRERKGQRNANLEEFISQIWLIWILLFLLLSWDRSVVLCRLFSPFDFL